MMLLDIRMLICFLPAFLFEFGADKVLNIIVNYTIIRATWFIYTFVVQPSECFVITEIDSLCNFYMTGSIAARQTQMPFLLQVKE